ncbi:MAG: amidohydrolase family protein [Myxococcota bacterium]
MAAYGRGIAEAPIENFGASVGFGSVRLDVMMSVRTPHMASERVEVLGLRGRWTAFRSLFGEVRDGLEKRASPAQRERMRHLLESGLDAGALGIGYEDVQWSATGERLDRQKWETDRRAHPTGQVIHHSVQEAWTRRALVEPGVMVVSDILPIERPEIKSTPHGGTFAEILGHYVRDERLLDLPTAIAKMTLLPARRLEAIAPVFARKGRLRVGADADVSVFDPEIVRDRSTYAEPFPSSTGIDFVIVNGVVVVREGELVEGAAPGRRLPGGDASAGSEDRAPAERSRRSRIMNGARRGRGRRDGPERPHAPQITRPDVAPVYLPRSITTWPLTRTAT